MASQADVTTTSIANANHEKLQSRVELEAVARSGLALLMGLCDMNVYGAQAPYLSAVERAARRRLAGSQQPIADQTESSAHAGMNHICHNTICACMALFSANV